MINFNDEIKEGLVLVDFYADWCGPCKMMHPIIEEIKKTNNIKTILVNVDEQSDIANKYSIMSIPTLILFKDGIIVNKNIGFTPKNIIEDWIKNNE